MGKGTEWSDKEVKEHWQVEVEGFSVGIAVRAGAGMYHSIAIAVRAGTEMNLSVEIAEACWWLLLRSALCATPNYWPPALLLPLNRAAMNIMRLVRIFVRGREIRSRWRELCAAVR